MRTIKILADVRCLRGAHAFSTSFHAYLEEEFLGLKSIKSGQNENSQNPNYIELRLNLLGEKINKGIMW